MCRCSEVQSAAAPLDRPGRDGEAGGVEDPLRLDDVVLAQLAALGDDGADPLGHLGGEERAHLLAERRVGLGQPQSHRRAPSPVGDPACVTGYRRVANGPVRRERSSEVVLGELAELVRDAAPARELDGRVADRVPPEPAPGRRPWSGRPPIGPSRSPTRGGAGPPAGSGSSSWTTRWCSRLDTEIAEQGDLRRRAGAASPIACQASCSATSVRVRVGGDRGAERRAIGSPTRIPVNRTRTVTVRPARLLGPQPAGDPVGEVAEHLADQLGRRRGAGRARTGRRPSGPEPT